MWIHLANIADFDHREILGVVHGNQQIAIFRLGELIYATDNICSHQYARLSDGYIVDNCVECPLHQGLFEVSTGKAQGGIVKKDIRTFQTRLDGNQIFVLVE